MIPNGVTHACPTHAIPGNAADGHHDGKVCLSEWKSFFDWCTKLGQGEKYLAKGEKAADALEKFNARVEAAFKALDYDESGDLSLAKMERIFGAETHDFWVDMGHQDDRVSLSEWKSFFSWCTAHHGGTNYLAKAEKAASIIQKKLQELEAYHNAEAAVAAGKNDVAKQYWQVAAKSRADILSITASAYALEPGNPHCASNLSPVMPSNSIDIRAY